MNPNDYYNLMMGNLRNQLHDNPYSQQQEALRHMYEAQQNMMKNKNIHSSSTKSNGVAEKYAGDIVDAEFEVILDEPKLLEKQ